MRCRCSSWVRVVAQRGIAEDRKAKHWDIVRVYCGELTSRSTVGGRVSTLHVSIRDENRP